MIQVWGVPPLLLLLVLAKPEATEYSLSYCWLLPPKSTPPLARRRFELRVWWSREGVEFRVSRALGFDSGTTAAPPPTPVVGLDATCSARLCFPSHCAAKVLGFGFRFMLPSRRPSLVATSHQHRRHPAHPLLSRVRQGFRRLGFRGCWGRAGGRGSRAWGSEAGHEAPSPFVLYYLFIFLSLLFYYWPYEYNIFATPNIPK